jgi:hypothetical protein
MDFGWTIINRKVAKMKKYIYEMVVAVSQLVCAIIMLIYISWTASFWMYLALAIPPLLLLATLLFHRQLAYFSRILFWLFFMVGFVIFWFNPTTISLYSINEYSITAVVFLILNTVICIAASRSRINLFFGYGTPLAEESPEILATVNSVISKACSVCEIPLFLLIFFIPGGLKFGLCVVLLFSGFAGGTIIGRFSAIPLLRRIRRQEEEQLKAAIREEEDHRK